MVITLTNLLNPVVITGFVMVLLGLVLLAYNWFRLQNVSRLHREAEERARDLKHRIESERREASIKIKDELYKKRQQFEREMKEERLDLDRSQKKLQEKYDALEVKENRMDDMRRELHQKERTLSRTSDMLRISENKLKTVYNELVAKLERISGMSVDAAKKMLLDTLSNEVKESNERWVQKIENEARETAKTKSIRILADTMQRYAVEQVSQHSASIIHLPNDDMKGRIIGKEGRNIKALENATGMEFVIGDTPEIITISGFNPIRREIARTALERLIGDGRINPTRIEETVEQCEKEINEMIEEYGKNAAQDLDVQGLHPELITLLGKLYFRTSFTQNVLEHSKEVGMFARTIAEELGLNGSIAARAGLLHDIGKAVSAEIEGPHARIGADIAKRCGEDALVVNAIAAHHEEVPYVSIYSLIIVIADTISASRPGARRETLAAYIKRLESLEDLAMKFDGVKRAFALQAGREVRIIVQEDYLDDDKAAILARDVAKKIEDEMNFPGQIKVNVIREKRIVEYAR
ncbi:ribonuclease Y [Candidatus Babeliales bacterium]|nr:ribonuclease Y [Candidatus Babeliales bacterium]